MPNLPSPHAAVSDEQYISMLKDIRRRGGNRHFKRSFKQSLVHSAASLFVRGYADLILLTSGARLDDPYNAVSNFAEGSGSVGASWHGNLLSTLLAYRSLCRAVKITGRYQSLSSESRDGELIARIFRDCGGACVRGSAKKRALGAVRQGVAELKRGANLFITIDGPRGPRHQPKDGALQMARLSGRPILPVSGSFGRVLKFRGSWDQFELPLPFGHFTFHIGEPLFVPEKLSDEQLESYRDKLKTRMHAVTARAESMSASIYGVGTPYEERRKRQRQAQAGKA